MSDVRRQTVMQSAGGVEHELLLSPQFQQPPSYSEVFTPAAHPPPPSYDEVIRDSGNFNSIKIDSEPTRHDNSSTSVAESNVRRARLPFVSHPNSVATVCISYNRPHAEVNASNSQLSRRPISVIPTYFPSAEPSTLTQTIRECCSSSRNSRACRYVGVCLTVIVLSALVGIMRTLINESTPSSVCDNGPCKNGGTCVDKGIYSHPSYICQCTPTFSGPRCESAAFHPCWSSPCKNGGICSSVRSGEYTCRCPIYYYGPNCESYQEDSCKSFPCQNGGRCQRSSWSYSCHCTKEFVGNDCDVRLVDAACNSQPCLNGGHCSDLLSSGTNKPIYQCTCLKNYYGRNCEYKIGFWDQN